MLRLWVVEHWKNPHAKIFYIRKQKEPRKPKEEIYSNSKIIQVVKTYWELGHEHKFITEIIARRANKYLVSITEPDYKNLNKNDIEDIYLLIMNGKCSVSYADANVDSFKRCCTSYTFDVGYRVLRDLLLHRSSINNSIADRIRDLCLRQELLEYLDVYDNDASESLQPSWGKKYTLMLSAQLPVGSSVYYFT
ncbi:hypothetical protein Tco_0549663 [Tanacetum coccineum]